MTGKEFLVVCRVRQVYGMCAKRLMREQSRLNIAGPEHATEEWAMNPNHMLGSEFQRDRSLRQIAKTRERRKKRNPRRFLSRWSRILTDIRLNVRQ
jgi:hypothetical protein